MKKLAIGILFLALLPWIVPPATSQGVYPPCEDRGTAGILGALEKLPVYAHVLYVTAHPDDESGGTLAWLARGMHARTTLFAFTRGEGGQNILGNEKYEALGLARTGELLAACRVYGVETYFSTAFEFGFSKSAEETFSKWGHEDSLRELVRFIRQFRPSIVISAFRGNAGDGHGHHQAAGILAAEAWQAAGDPDRFPELAKHGLVPYQPKKLYCRSRSGATGTIVDIPTGAYNPVLGRSYREIGAEGYSKHRTQGNGASYEPPGRYYDHLELIHSTVEKGPKEESIFDSVDISLSSIAKLGEGQSLPFLETDLAAAQKNAREALEAFQPSHPERSAPAIAGGIAVLAGALQKLETSQLKPAAKAVLKDALQEKLHDFEDALSAVLGIYLAARVEDPTAVAGETVKIAARFLNRGAQPLELKAVTLITPPDWPQALLASWSPLTIEAGGESDVSIPIQVPASAKVTEPFWYREDPGDNRYKTRRVPDPFAPFESPVLSVEARYGYQGVDIPIRSSVTAVVRDALRGAYVEDFQIVPALSIELNPSLAILPASGNAAPRDFRVSVQSNLKSEIAGTIKLQAPNGWTVEPSSADFTLRRKAEEASVRFRVRAPGSVAKGNYLLSATANAAGREYRQGVQVISYPGIWTRYLYSPATAKLEAIDVKIAPNLTIGYIMGAGDEVPEALEQLGAKVTLLSGSDLENGDFSRFDAIVTGIRAYNVNDSLRAANRKLLQYVENGGILIVQYVRPMREYGSGDGTHFPFGPYPMSNTDADRITVEDSPVRILDPQNPVFNLPNKITSEDFIGWVQERGLYFMRRWDPRYKALLSGNDPGEPPKDGGMLLARYGKGYYIYTAYAWFRQLPAGVPGAYRIFANMLSLGK